MIVIDTSAIVAIALREPDLRLFEDAIASAVDPVLPASCYLETVMVLYRWRVARAWVDRYLHAAGVAVIGADARQARLAADAFERYGRGTGHHARLNFGDCLSYAAAAALGSPLLFKGDDFARTDIASALG